MANRTDKRIAKLYKELDKLQNQHNKSNRLLAELEDIYGRIMHTIGNLYVKHTEAVKGDIDKSETVLKKFGRL